MIIKKKKFIDVSMSCTTADIAGTTFEDSPSAFM